MCFSNHDGSLLERQLGAVHGLLISFLREWHNSASEEVCFISQCWTLPENWCHRAEADLLGYVRYFIHCAQPKGCDLLLCMWSMISDLPSLFAHPACWDRYQCKTASMCCLFPVILCAFLISSAVKWYRNLGVNWLGMDNRNVTPLYLKYICRRHMYMHWRMSQTPALNWICCALHVHAHVQLCRQV